MMARLGSLKHFRIHSGQQEHLPVRLSTRLRQAQFSGLSLSSAARRFTVADLHPLETFRPQVLIATCKDLQVLAHQSAAGQCDLLSVDYAVIAVTHAGQETLTDKDRVILWQAFGVPVFEALIESDGSLLAAECEAQEGWHLRPGVRAFVSGNEILLQHGSKRPRSSGYNGSVEQSVCPCGRATARLLALHPTVDPLHLQEGALAATA